MPIEREALKEESGIEELLEVSAMFGNKEIFNIMIFVKMPSS